jgi:transposase InsO family protein
MQILLLGVQMGADLCRFIVLFLIPVAALRAENVFLRKQLAMFLDRGVKPRCAKDRERLTLVILAKLFNRRDALVVVSPRTFKSWQKAIERSFWRWISRPKGRPPISTSLRAVIRRIAKENPQWSCGQIARVVEVQLGAPIDENSVRKYLPLSDPRRRGGKRGDQTWKTSLENHAKAVAACDFVSVMTLRFQILYVFLVMEIGSRRILHVNVTQHPTREWTSQQMREAIEPDSSIQYLIHDGAGMFNDAFRSFVRRLGVKPLRTPPYAPKANAFCERLVGTLRRDCLDWIIPLSENQLRALVREWAEHYNRGHPHMSLGPGVPEPGERYPAPLLSPRHAIPSDARIVSKAVLGGLHHEYHFEKLAT